MLASSNIGESSIISVSVNVKLLNGSSKEDVWAGNFFKFSGELISSHYGKIQIGDHCLVGSRCVVGAVNKVILGD